MPLKIIPIVWGIVCLFAACGHSGKQTGSQAGNDTVTDDYGRTVVIPAHPQRVVSLSPAVTEIMFALGADDVLVGRTDFCTYPQEAESIPSIGGISNLNIESILALSPDLVISGSMVGKKVTDQMDQMGTPMVCVIEKPRFEALYDNIRAIGRLVGKEKEADSLNKELSNKVAELISIATQPLGHSATQPLSHSATQPLSHSATQPLSHSATQPLSHSATQPLSHSATQPLSHSATPPLRHSVYYVVGFGPTGNFTAGGNTFINDIIRMAGGRNIAEEVEGWNYSLEALMQENPDYIIVRREDSAAFCGMKPYNTLDAVRKGHVIGIVSGTLDLQVPRNIDAILYLRQRMSR